MSETLGGRAQRLLGTALEMATVVREQDRDGITTWIAEHVSDADKDAMLVVLAALVDVDQTAEELLAWVTWDENGKPLRPAKPRFAAELSMPLARYIRAQRDGQIEAALLVAHAEYVRLRKNRLPIPDWIREGQKTYDKSRKKAQRAAS